MSEDYYTGMVQDAIADLGPRFEGWVPLRVLRAALAAVPREVIDDVLRELYLRPRTQLIPQADRTLLTEADRAAALHLAGRDRHLICLDARGGAR